MPKFLIIFLIFFSVFTSIYKFNQAKVIPDAISPICEESNNQFNNNVFRLIKKPNILNSDNSFYNFKNELVNSQVMTLNLLINDSNGWFTNLRNLAISNTAINDEYKKNFLAKIIFSDGTNNCILSGEVRISGDYADHIMKSEFEQLYLASMEVSLFEGNVYKNTKFKLFLPQTRNGQNEILITTLFNQLGFMAPETFFVDVNVNGIAEKYLFQEKIINGFLLSKNKKEGPIIESDVPSPSIWDKKSIDLGRIINKKWLSQNKYNLLYGYKALEIYSKMRVFHDKNNNDLVDLNLESLNSKSQHQLRQFLLLNLVLENWHSLDVGNRKFYIDPLDDTVYPIYYDGGSSFLDNKSYYYLYSEDKNNPYADFTIDQTYLEDIYILQNQINNLDMESLILNLQNRGIDDENILFLKLNFKKIINERLINLENNISSDYSRSNYSVNEYFQKSSNNYKNYFLMFRNENNFKYCDTKLENCREINLSTNDEINLLNGNYFIDEKKVYFVGSALESLASNIKKNEIFSNKIVLDDFTIFSNNKIEYKLSNKYLEIHAENDSRYLIKDSKITDMNISLIYENVNNIMPEYEALRYDELFLTGCLNIYDSNLLNVKINITNTQCEDSINLVRTYGSIDELLIANATYDALDADFSNLLIKSINVLSAFNDCIDVSKGMYEFNYIIVENCKDKGLSIGEGSTVRIKDLKVDKSVIGMAVKDSSNVYIDELRVLNSTFCASLYRKKQEFGPSKLEVKRLFCESGDTYFQNDSYTLFYEKDGIGKKN